MKRSPGWRRNFDGAVTEFHMSEHGVLDFLARELKLTRPEAIRFACRYVAWVLGARDNLTAYLNKIEVSGGRKPPMQRAPDVKVGP